MSAKIAPDNLRPGWLEVRDLVMVRGTKKAVEGIELRIAPGKITALAGANGAGKSTLLHTIMGRPDISVNGTVSLDDTDLTDLACHERAKAGVFLAHQAPPAIDGVNTMSVFKEIQNAQNAPPRFFRRSRGPGTGS